MSVTQEYDLTRFMETLDGVLLGLRDRSDDLDPRSGVSIIDSVRRGCLGIVGDTFSMGVIFGLDLCQVGDIASTSYGMMGGYEMGGGSDPRDWVVTRGALFDGTQIRNLEPLDGVEYVYKLALPSGMAGANFLAPGAIVYDTSTAAFRTRMLGQSGYTSVFRTIEKTNVSTSEIVEAALGENPQDDDLHVQPTATQIVIGRFVVDVELMGGGESDYVIVGSSARDRYPLPSGIPHPSYAQFAVDIDTAMGITDDPTFDATIAYNVLLPIVNAAVWGGSFYGYWTAGGRVLPTNVKYYYNQLWDPDIP